MTTLHFAPTTRFHRPGELTAAEPAEHRGLRRDQVRLLTARGGTSEPARVAHTRFDRIADQLEPGDLIVVNNSATIAGELAATSAEGDPLVAHLATPLPDGNWVIELRSYPDGARAILDARPGQHLGLAGGGHLQLIRPYPDDGGSPTGRGNRLWRARVQTTRPVLEHLERFGRPISYGYLSRHWPLSYYQTVFATEPGSAEMPSAGRPFTAELVTSLVSSGIPVASITLHTGVSSQEAGEPPQAERFSVPAATAAVVNATRTTGGRVIAVGTTVTRALESAADEDGHLHARSGWTELVIGPDHPARVVTGLITGLHDPDASHLLLVESVAGAELTQLAYDAAVSERYLWHEFGDSCLLLPS